MAIVQDRTGVEELLVRASTPELRNEIEQMILRTGALLIGDHYVLKSGYHSDQFIRFSAIVKFPTHVKRLATALAEKLSSLAPDCVVVPNNAATVLGYELALQLHSKVAFVDLGAAGYPARFAPNFEVPPGERVVLLVDIVTTGQSLRCLDSLSSNAGLEVVAAAAFAERGMTEISQLDLSCPEENRFVLAKFKLNHWLGIPGVCDLCSQGIPVVSSMNLQA